MGVLHGMPILQSLINGFVRGGELTLLAIGLTMIYGNLRFANFAHTEFATIGAYLALLFTVTMGFNIFLSGFLAIMITGVIAIAIDRMTFSRLREAGALSLMVLSIGIAIGIRSIVQAIWGARIQGYPIGILRGIQIFGARITPIQILIVATAIISMVLFHLLLKRTRIGKAMRATSDNMMLAQASGIDTEGVIKWVWFIGASFAGMGGVLIGLETQLRPDMGFAMLLPVFATAILGGIGNVYGAMLGGLLLGFVENLGIGLDFGSVLSFFGISNEGLYIRPSYKPALAFGVLILMLLVRPRGILGERRGR